MSADLPSCDKAAVTVSVVVPVRIDETLRPGLAFMTFHFNVATNLLTIEATDPKSGTAEFKASAIRIDKLAETADKVALQQRTL